MSEATTPVNPTDQIAAVVATPAVVQDAQRVIKQVTEVVRAADRAFESSGGSSRHWVREQFIPRLEDAGLRIVPAAYIERLEAEMEDALAYVARVEATNEKVIAERNAAERDVATLQSIVGNTVKAELLRELFRAYSDGELVARREGDTR